MRCPAAGDCGAGRRAPRALGGSRAGVGLVSGTQRRETGRDRRLVEGIARSEPGGASEPDERRAPVRHRRLGRGERRARARRARSSAPRRARGSRSIRPMTLGSCSAHRIADPARASSSSRSATEAVPAGSSWAVGSSRTRTVVPIATMLAMATRCCSPPDRANGSRSARWPIDSRSSVASIRASISDARDAEVLEPERELLADRQLRGRQLVGRRREDDADPAEQRASRPRSPRPARR